MKTLLFVVAILIATPAIYAQSKPIKVNVDAASDPVSPEFADKVAARVGSTSRYALVSTPTEILVSVSCLSNTNVVNGQELGVTCDIDILYWPVSDVALSITCVGSMATGMSKSDVAQLCLSRLSERLRMKN